MVKYPEKKDPSLECIFLKKYIGTLHYAKCFGGDPGETPRADDVHWIASATKFITSIAVMQCVEKGLLDLDADISTILPEWKDPKILIGFSETNEPQFQPAKRPLTLRYACCP